MRYYIIPTIYATCSTVPLLTPLDSHTKSVTHGTQYMANDLSSGAPTLQYRRWDVNAQVPTTDPVLIPNEGTQVSGPAAVQTQPHLYGAPGLAPMPSNGSGVGQSMLHHHTEELYAGGDPVNASAGLTIDEMSSDDVEWNGTLHLNGAHVRARARANEAARNPFVLS
jgi:hypothetical protein